VRGRHFAQQQPATGEAGEGEDVGVLHGEKFWRPPDGREARGVHEQCGRRTQDDHHGGECYGSHAKPAMQIRARVADQGHLHREQHQPADEGNGMAMHDQRIVEPVPAHVVEAVGAEA
jgi:hypothetical protein